MSLKDNRREYDYGTLSRDSLHDNPFTQFSLWMDQAIQADIIDPTAMSVATVGQGGKPWQRMVLLKGFDERGFVFYTNLGSRKATDIAVNPSCQSAISMATVRSSGDYRWTGRGAV